MTDEHTSRTGQDAGEHPGRPADEPRSEREVGGPTAADPTPGPVEEAPDAGTEGRGHGDRPAPFEPHE